MDDKFWSKVIKTNSCWNWIGATARGGYGSFRFKGKTSTASRVAWIITNGTIPNGLLICHKCDNPSCVNPDHLFLGTAKDNAHDKINKGRAIPPPVFDGIDNPQNVLTEDQVRTIRAEWAGKWGQQTSLAKRFGVDRKTIYHIVNGLQWKNLK